MTGGAGSSLRCGASHNEGDYSDADQATISNAGLGTFKWNKRQGWHISETSLAKCQEACESHLDCIEISITPTGLLCYVAKTTCYGGRVKRNAKYVLETQCGTSAPIT